LPEGKEKENAQTSV